VSPQPFVLRAPDGRELAAHWFAASQRRGVIVFNGATGFRQSFYFKLAEYAAERGYDVLLYDYRGMGLSAPADLASDITRMSDWGMLDMRAALDAGAARAQGLPVVTFGHSVGGQFLGLLRNHRLACAHVQIATSVGYWRWEHAPFRYLAWWFWRVHGPLMLALRATFRRAVAGPDCRCRVAYMKSGDAGACGRTTSAPICIPT
jgi:predicted alpha/beta hydrolase